MAAERIDVEMLRRVPSLSELSPAALEGIARVGRRKTYAAGEPILREGTYGGLFVMISGVARVEAGGKAHQLGPGQFVGEMSLLSGKPRSATVTAVEPVEALAIDTVNFKAYLLANPSVAVAILEQVVERLREVQERLEGGAVQPAEG